MSSIDAESSFDAEAKEKSLVAESTSWDVSAPVDAAPGDIPIVDVSHWFATGSASALAAAAAVLREASERIGFFYLTGHGIDPALIEATFEATAAFHALPHETREKILLNGPGTDISGIGYLPFDNHMLPRRDTGNQNEAFLIKGDAAIGLDDNQWLSEADAPGFRAAVESWLDAVKGLALRLLPLYAVALDLPEDFFADGFTHPFFRLRFTHYPPAADRTDAGKDRASAFGISPHVDTTFFTLLLQDSPGLTIHNAARDQWINAPLIANAFVVNSGELLRQWSNDRFLSTRHFANNPSATSSRYSIPLFFNANADHPMECLPTCYGPGNPPKYPTISYLESQGVFQGE